MLNDALNGKILNVRLTEGTTEAEEIPEETYRAYLGGYGLGARLLFDGHPDSPSPPKKLQPLLDALDADLQVTMKVMEDALCNWQKSPTSFIHYKG